MNKKTKNIIILPYTIWMICFIIVPLLFMIYFGFTNKLNQFTIENILSIFNQDNLKSLILSLELSLISTIICLIISYPLALILKNMNVGKSSFLVFLFILPMWMNSLLRIVAWLTLLEKKGIINSFLLLLGLPRLDIINTPIAIVLGMVYDFLPFMILPIYNSLTKIDDNTINAAYDLGANFFNVLIKIIIPLSMPGIISGITMVFIPSLTTVAIPNILGGGQILLIGNVIEQEFIQSSNWHRGAGLSIVLVIFILIITSFVDRHSEKDDKILM
ncbi:MAG: ABC transporter permease [Eubacteriales bacterium]|nr:ABC transporter permease [Eubacteriales bacterium]